MEINGRIIEELPKFFVPTKKEFEKNIAHEKAISNNENKKIELEKYSVIFALIQELESFLNKHEENISIHIKELMDELNEYSIVLGKYGKKLEWDENANWFYLSDMNKSDWLHYDKECNEKYLKDRKSK